MYNRRARKNAGTDQASQGSPLYSKSERQIQLSNGGILIEAQDGIIVLEKWPGLTRPQRGEYLRLQDGRILCVLGNGRLRVATADEQEQIQETEIVYDDFGPRGTRSRWAAAIDLMRYGGAVEEFEANEPSYQTDHASAMLTLARQVG
jgi:hypothetical protein